MALADAVKGALRPAQQITWTREDGDAENLTGATITGFIRNQSTGVTAAIAGTLALTTPASGIFTWTYAAADVATAGGYEVQFVATFGSDPTPAKTVVTGWSVLDGLST